MVMQSQGGIELVAELPQCPKKQDGYQVRRRLRRIFTREAAVANCSLAQLLTSQVASRSPEPTALNLSVTSRHPAKKGEIKLERKRTWCLSCGIRFSNTLRKWA